MSSNIVKFYPKNAAEKPDLVLEQAIGVYDDVLIIGWDTEGNLDVRTNASMTQREALWIMELFKTKLMNGDYCAD